MPCSTSTELYTYPSSIHIPKATIQILKAHFHILVLFKGRDVPTLEVVINIIHLKKMKKKLMQSTYNILSGIETQLL